MRGSERQAPRASFPSWLPLAALVVASGVLLTHACLQLLTLGSASLRFDYQQYFDAAQALNQGADPYAIFLNNCGQVWCTGGYIYPPLLAQAFRPLALLPFHTGATVWLVASYLCLLAAAVAANRTVAPWLGRQARMVLLAAAFAFMPLYSSLEFLQVGTLMLLLLSLAALAFSRRRDALAGAAVGLGAVLRVSPVIQLPMFIRSRRDVMRPAGMVGFAVAAAGLVGLMAILTPSTSEYFTTVLPRLGAGTAVVANQSISGFLLRAAVVGAWPAAATRWAIAGLQVILLAVTWVFSIGVEGERRRAAVFATFLAVTPIVSAITWDHHLITELLVLTLVAPSLRRASPAWWCAVLCYPLLWIPRELTDPILVALGGGTRTGPAALPYVLVTGTNLAGMLLLWIGCLGALWSTAASGAGQGQLQPVNLHAPAVVDAH